MGAEVKMQSIMAMYSVLYGSLIISTDSIVVQITYSLTG